MNHLFAAVTTLDMIFFVFPVQCQTVVGEHRGVPSPPGPKFKDFGMNQPLPQQWRGKLHRQRLLWDAEGVFNCKTLYTLLFSRHSRSLTLSSPHTCYTDTLPHPLLLQGLCCSYNTIPEHIFFLLILSEFINLLRARCGPRATS